jgi:lipopolysaccharide assembly protein A
MPRDDTVDAPLPAGPVRRVAMRYWVALILVALAALFVAQNRERVRVHVLWVTVESPMWSILVIIFVVGLLIGQLLRRRRRS